MKIRVGGIYRNRKGDIIMITRRLVKLNDVERSTVFSAKEEMLQPFSDSEGKRYTEDGWFQFFEGSDYDLIEEVE